MKTRILALLLAAALLLPCVAAQAAGMYIIPDSDTRELTAEELWTWSYESLGFILNEIFARHGYNFEPGGKYYNFFTQRPWYTPNANPNNQAACYPHLSQVEWRNEALVKQVRAEMRAVDTRNTSGKDYLDYIESGFDFLGGFTLAKLKSGQKLAVYAAPATAAYRGANGKASVSTSGAVYAAGWENGWLLVMYETNGGAVRVGYVNGSSLKGDVNLPTLQFAYTPATCLRRVSLTDDPATSFTTLLTLQEGATVTYLTNYANRYDWAYVETTLGGQTVRGFIPADALDTGFGLDEGEVG